MSSTKAGRPRQFDRTSALQAALALFWRQGYGSSSLDDLTREMGIGRSSFYASFGSKHAVLMEVLEVYTAELLARIKTSVASSTEPKRALMSLLEVVACTNEPSQGCLFVNSVNELLPGDTDVADLARRHLGNVEREIVGLFQRLGLSREESRARSGAMLALATGAITLRKAGASAKRVRAVLDRLSSLLV